MTGLILVLWITHSGQVSPCSKCASPDSSLMSGSLLLILCPHAVSNSNHLTEVRWRIIMNDIISLFSCIYLCRSWWELLHICSWAPWASLWWEPAGGGGWGGWEGGIGCCTCLLPWGFWRSDYAGCGIEDLFSRGDAWQKKEKKRRKKKSVYMSQSLSRQLYGGHLF